MLYFEGLEDEKGIKLRYKELAKLHHPDRGGCVETMKAINLQYEKVITGAYQRAGKSITEIEELLKKDAVLLSKLYEILSYEEINVEVCGKWIWVTGNTKPIKDILKAANFRWASNKCSWFWRSEEDKSFNRKKMTLEEIRNAHGSKTINKQNFVAIG